MGVFQAAVEAIDPALLDDRWRPGGGLPPGFRRIAIVPHDPTRWSSSSTSTSSVVFAPAITTFAINEPKDRG